MLETIRSDNLPENGSELSAASSWSSSEDESGDEDDEEEVDSSASASASSSEEEGEYEDEGSPAASSEDGRSSRKRKRKQGSASSVAAAASSSSSSAKPPGRRKKKHNRTLRRRVLEEYYCSTCFGAATAMVAYEISKEDGKDTNDLLWLAIVGLTSYYVRADIDQSRYIQLLADVQIEVANKNGSGQQKYMTVEDVATQRSTQASSTTEGLRDDGTEVLRGPGGPGVRVPVAEEGRISLQFDYRFMLYRHWNLYESMLFSDYVSTTLKLWTSGGRANLEKFIAKMGIPLKECRQKFAYMSERLKGRLKTSAEDCSREFELDEILFQTFSRQDGFSDMISASDLVHITTALLECETDAGAAAAAALESASSGRKNRGGQPNEDSATKGSDDDAASKNSVTKYSSDGSSPLFETANDNKRWIARFNRAYDSLRKNSHEAYESGIACAKRLQKVVFQMASSVIERKQVRNSGPFRYTLLQNLTASEAAYFVQPRVLARLAKFVVTAFVVQKKWTDRRAKPYIMCVANEARGTHIVVGVMCPGRFEVQRNYLGKAFRYAAESVKATYKHDGFDTAAIELGRNASPTQFLSALHDRLSPLDD
eukprot:g4838.t1